jgi:hypothetical protein
MGARIVPIPAPIADTVVDDGVRVLRRMRAAGTGVQGVHGLPPAYPRNLLVPCKKGIHCTQGPHVARVIDGDCYTMLGFDNGSWDGME